MQNLIQNLPLSAIRSLRGRMASANLQQQDDRTSESLSFLFFLGLLGATFLF